MTIHDIMNTGSPIPMRDLYSKCTRKVANYFRQMYLTILLFKVMLLKKGITLSTMWFVGASLIPYNEGEDNGFFSSRARGQRIYLHDAVSVAFYEILKPVLRDCGWVIFHRVDHYPVYVNSFRVLTDGQRLCRQFCKTLFMQLHPLPTSVSIRMLLYKTKSSMMYHYPTLSANIYVREISSAYRVSLRRHHVANEYLLHVPDGHTSAIYS